MKPNRMHAYVRFVVFAMPVVVITLVGSPSFDSSRWILQNFRIFSVQCVWTEYFFSLLIVITLCFFSALLFESNIGRRIISKIQYRNNALLFVPLFLSIVIMIYYFQAHNLYNLNMIMTDDYPIHHLRGWYLIEVLIPKFQSIFGFSHYFWAGYPTLDFYPPGFYLTMALLNSVKIPIQATIRVFQFLILVLFPVVPFLFCRYLGYGSVSSLTSSLWLLYSVTWLKFLIFGLVPFLFAALLGAFFILFLIRVSAQNKLTSPLHILVSAISISAISIMHFTVGILLGVVLVFFVLYHFKWKTLREARNALFFVSVLSVFAVLSTLFISLPMLTAYLNKVHTSETFGLEVTTSVETLTLGLWEIFYNNIIWGLLLIQAIGVILALRNRRRGESLLIIVFVVSLFFSIVGLCTINTPIQDLWFLRFLVFVEIFGSVFVGRFFDELIEFLKQIDRKNQTSYGWVRTKQHLLRKAWIKSFYGSLLIVLIFVSFVTVFSHVRNPFPEFVFEDKYGTMKFVEEEDHTSLDDNVEKVIQWLRQDTTNQSRIMIEDSGATGFHFWGGHIPAILPILTNRYFIGGYQPIHWYAWSNFATCREGEAFGVKFEEMNITYFMSNLKKFNVRYLVLWSTEAKRFANSFPDYLDKVKGFESINIYNFTKASDSYCSTNSLTATVQIIHFEPEKIQIKIYNASEGDAFRLSLFRHPNYEAYLNNTRVDFSESESLMSFSIPESGNFDIEIIWTKPLAEVISTIISILAWVLGLSFLAYLFAKRCVFFLHRLRRIPLQDCLNSFS